MFGAAVTLDTMPGRPLSPHLWQGSACNPPYRSLTFLDFDEEGGRKVDTVVPLFTDLTGPCRKAFDCAIDELPRDAVSPEALRVVKMIASVWGSHFSVVPTVDDVGEGGVVIQVMATDMDGVMTLETAGDGTLIGGMSTNEKSNIVRETLKSPSSTDVIRFLSALKTNALIHQIDWATHSN